MNTINQKYFLRTTMSLLLMLLTSVSAWAESKIVTKDNFYSFFDEYGYLLDAVTSGELIFQGDFSGSDLVNYIVLDRAITITGNKENTGDKAKFNDIGFVIAADGVTLKNVTLEATTSLGELIYVNGCNVILDNISVTYNAPDNEDAKAIFADGADNFILINSEITFTGATPGSNHYRGLEVCNCDAAIIDNNTISAEFPAVDIDWGEYGTIDQDLVLAVGIQSGEDVEFTNNIVTVNTNGAVGSYPTIEAVMIYSTDNILIKGNNITHLDTTTEDGIRYYYSLDIYETTGTVEANDIIVNTTTTVDRAGTAYPIQVTGPSTVTIIANNLTAISKGSVYGIYATNWMGGETTLTVENNNIDVTGYATTGNYALVAGIEAEIEVLEAYGNTIIVDNVADYDDADANQVIGVGIGYTWFYGDMSADIQDNNMTVDGKYAVYYTKVVNTNVTDNILCAHLFGDAAVYIAEGNGNTVKDNLGGTCGEDDPNTTTVDESKNVTWLYDNDTHTLTISGTGPMMNYGSALGSDSKYHSTAPWSYLDSEIQKVIVGDGVTCIGDYAFYACSNLATVTLNSNPYIGDAAFPDATTVTMNLTANSAGGAKWMTFCSSGYNFQADANTQVFQAELVGSTLTLREIADGIVNVGEGVILKSTGNPVMTLTTTDSSDDYDYNSLIGVLNPAGRDNDGCFYVLNYKAATGVGFYKLAASKTTLEYGKAFLWYDSSSSAPLRDYFEFLQDEDATGIQQTEAVEAEDYGTVYDLQGRPVTNPAPGIYIVNGKKVFIK